MSHTGPRNEWTEDASEIGARHQDVKTFSERSRFHARERTLLAGLLCQIGAFEAVYRCDLFRAANAGMQLAVFHSPAGKVKR